MKLKIKREFVYMVGTETRRIPPGVYDVPASIDEILAAKVLKWGSAEKVVEKKAPENKVVKIAESKAGVVKPSKRSRRTRAKPKS